MHCPKCGGEYREGITECADCKVALVTLAPGEVPRRVRGPLFPTIPTIPKRPDDRPGFIKVVPWLAALSCARSGFFSLLCFAESLSHGPIRFKPSQRLSAALHSPQTPALIAALLWAGAALLAFLIAYSFWRQLVWSRHLLTTVSIANAVQQCVSDPQEVLKNTIMFVVDTRIPYLVVTLGWVVWYFYFKPNVRAYFRRLESQEALVATDPQS